MEFFEYTDGHFSVGTKFWLYWVITLPLTALVIVIWKVWMYYRYKEDIPPRIKGESSSLPGNVFGYKYKRFV